MNRFQDFHCYCLLLIFFSIENEILCCIIKNFEIKINWSRYPLQKKISIQFRPRHNRIFFQISNAFRSQHCFIDKSIPSAFCGGL